MVGKPAAIGDADPGSFMTPEALSQALVAEYQYSGWKTGVFFWQYSSDANGTIINQTMSSLMSLLI